MNCASEPGKSSASSRPIFRSDLPVLLVCSRGSAQHSSVRQSVTQSSLPPLAGEQLSPYWQEHTSSDAPKETVIGFHLRRSYFFKPKFVITSKLNSGTYLRSTHAPHYVFQLVVLCKAQDVCWVLPSYVMGPSTVRG